MVNWALAVGWIGAITGLVSLGWHILNSRSKVILERVYFVKEDRHVHKVTIDVEANIRNKSNRATTIENIFLEVGNRWIQRNNSTHTKIEPNSTYLLKFSQSFTPEEFGEILKRKPVKLGLTIIHTFGELKRQGDTDFSTPWLTLSDFRA